jgi:hypothetical protein
MPTSANESLQSFYAFSERWLGRPLGEQERERLVGLVAAALAAQDNAATQQEQQAAALIESERRRVQAAITRMFESVDAARQAQQARWQADEAALKAVAASHGLDELRPSALRASQAGETAAERILVAQIADRLGNLVQTEVEACFDRRSGPRAQAGSIGANAQVDANVEPQATGEAGS